MEIIKREIPKDCTIIDTGDWHVGHTNCDKDGLLSMFERMQDPNCYMVIKGDLTDNITPNDRRYRHCSVDFQDNLMSGQQQAWWIIDHLKDFADRVIVIGTGNHDMKHRNYDPVQEICRQLDVPFGAWSFVIDWHNSGKTMFKWFCSHGKGITRSNAKDPIQRDANERASVKKILEVSGYVDCYYMTMGHSHNPKIVEPTNHLETVLVTTDDSIKQEPKMEVPQNSKYIPVEARYYVVTPSFLKLYSNPGLHAVPYGEVAMYRPVKLGWTEVKVSGGEIVDVSIVEV